MKINRNPKYLPVFHHIAKNAGTYVLSWMMILNRRYQVSIDEQEPGRAKPKGRVRRAIISLECGRQLTCCYHTPTSIHTKSKDFTNRPEGDDNTDFVDLKSFIHAIICEDVEVFSVSVDPSAPGIALQRDAVNLIARAAKREEQLNFTVLRDPFERARSLFIYLKGDESKHEPTHNSLKSNTFNEYIKSDEVEDSWLIRNLLNLEDGDIIEPKHFTLAKKYLDHFRIKDIRQVDDLINSVFHGCYGVMITDVDEHTAKKHTDFNKTPNKKKISFSDLSAESQEAFLDRTYWDRQIFDTYCKNV